MNFRFTIGKKIGAGFGILILLTIIVFTLTTVTLNKSRQINDAINHIYNPSVKELKELNLMIIRSKLLIYNWVFIQSGQDNFEKQQLIKLIETEFPQQKEKLHSLAENWTDGDRLKLDTLFAEIDKLYGLVQGDIMNQLVSFESYEDAMVMFMIRPMLEGGEIDIETNAILKRLSRIIDTQNERATTVNNEMLDSFSFLRVVVQNSGLLLVIGGIFIAFFTIRTIVKPVTKLKGMLLTMSKGIIPQERILGRSDEIGEMATAFDRLADSYERQILFSEEVGKGNFEAEYKPLSDEDTLGFVLLKMRDNIKESERILEEKVEERTAEVVRQKAELEVTNRKIAESINYARLIQRAILPERETILQFFPEFFMFYKARDVVSGDFPWFLKKGDDIYIAAVDCTGHGVPGALISIIGYFLLNSIVSLEDSPTPAEILDKLHADVRKTLKQESADAETRDGMDIALCKINGDKTTLEYSGAHRPLLLAREGEEEIIEIKGDKAAIGGKYDNKAPFSNHIVKIQKRDTIFFYSDGLVDQFGGPTKRKKFSTKRIKSVILEHKDDQMAELETAFQDQFSDWMSGTRQIDDVLLMSIRF